MIELLNRLAAADPELCTGPYEGNGVYHFTIGGYRFGFADGKLILRVYMPGFNIGESDAACWLQGILQQAIEARGWEYEHRYFTGPIGPRHRVIIMLGRDAGHLASTAAEALLAAYVAAVEGEKG